MQMYMAQNTFTASIHKENNLYVASCVEIGTVSQGSTVEEALANLKEFPVTAGTPVFLTTFTMEVYA
jgi:hypothetical protein